MRKLFCIAGLSALTHSLNGQTVIPQTIPCLTITQANLVDLGSGIEAPDCIETDGNVTFLQYENYSIKAGEYIEFGQNTVINPDASHQFHAYIDNGGMDVAWYFPNATPGTVGQFEKLELGVEFREDMDQLVENFTANPQITPNLNPFNPEQINLYAEFWWYSDGTNPFIPAGWYGPQLINGFYYEDYERGATDWTQQANQHDFRIRFAPRYLGIWRCKITAQVQGFGTFTASEFTFDCVESDSKDFMRVGDNGRYFRIGDDPFFPVGHNLVWPQGSSTGPWDRAFNPIVPPSFFVSYHQQMSDIISNGGNYMRFINNPWSTDCEFEKLNDYSDRMIHSWELDKILEHADSINLRIHFDLQIQYNFDVPDGFGVNHWDWSKYGDEFNDGECAVENDSGYCYRRELGLEDPIYFFSNSNAKKFYKYKLRYLIARYGYSNEIAVIELFSEINNAGAKHNMVKEFVELNEDGDSIFGCFNHGGAGTGKPYDSIPNFTDTLYAWQHEMAMYIKMELQHSNHPLAVSYGKPPHPDYDPIYSSPYIDINTYNAYQVLIEKFAINSNEVTQLTSIYGKPFMFSEYGPGDDTYKCDGNSFFIKTLVLSPFCGVAGGAMNWDWQSTDEQFLWHHMGPVNELMSGVKLDEENWQVGVPLVTEDKEVEVLYLYGPEIDNTVSYERKVAGAVSNRTYNYFTQGTISPCSDTTLELQNNPNYQVPQSFSYSSLSSELKIPNMGVNKTYNINWYNAFTGIFWQTTSATSGLSGDLELEYPGVITGNGSGSILFFEIYPEGSTFKSSVQDSAQTSLKQENLKLDTSIASIERTNWHQDSDSSFNDRKVNYSINPNPTPGEVQVQVDLSFVDQRANWILTSESGTVLQSQQINEANFVVDLSVYSKGTYIFILEINGNRYVSKIIRS